MKPLPINAAFVYLGFSLPKYFLKNIENFQETFPHIPLWVVVDDSRMACYLRKRNFNVFIVGEQVVNNSKTLSKKLRHDVEFRAGFWVKTLTRFLAIRDLMQEQQISNVLHIEGDVLCFPTFPFEKFKSLKEELAFPLESPRLGIASILYVRDLKAVKRLCEFALDEVERDPTTTDMRVLGRYREEFKERVLVLPTFTSLEQVNERYINEDLIHEILRSEKLFGGIFDSVSLGQYLFGIDPKNHRGIVKSFLVNSEHLINPQKYRFIDKRDSIAVETDEKNRLSDIYSLHIHSKDISAFSFPRNIGLIMKKYENSKHGISNRFSASTFISQAIYAARRRLNAR